MYTVTEEDVWRCSVGAAGEQAGPGRQPWQKSDDRGGAEAGRGEVHLNIQTTFLCDFSLHVSVKKKMFWA